MIEPLPRQVSEAAAYSRKEPLLFKMAYWLSCVTPAFKERLPRHFGALFGGHRKFCVKTPHDAYIAADITNLDHYTRMRRIGGWDEYVLLTIVDLLDRGATFYDVGANGGYMSVCAAWFFQGNIRVVSIEPQPRLAQLTAISMLVNGFDKFDVFPVLLGNVEKEETLCLTADTVHASIISRAQEHKRFEVKSTLSVPMTTLDALVGTYGAPVPDVVKLDVEGAELLVLRGGQNVFGTKHPAVIFESDVNMARFGYTRGDIMALLREYGYNGFYSINHDGRYEEIDKDVENANISDVAAILKSRVTQAFAAKIVSTHD